MPQGKYDRGDAARDSFLLCWTLFSQGKSMEVVCAATGLAPGYASHIKRARTRLSPEARKAFLEGEIGVQRALMLARISHEKQNKDIAGEPFARRGAPGARRMLHILLAMPESLRDEQWKGAKEALSWVLGLSDTCIGVK